MLILGMSLVGRNPAVALFNGGAGPVAAIEENKLARSGADGPLPQHAIEYCLKQAGAELKDISAIAVGGRARRARLREGLLRRSQTAGDARVPDAWTGSHVERQSVASDLLRRVVAPGVPFVSFEHHLCHAASAFYSSDFDRALVLTLDGSGDMWSGLLAVGEGSDLRMLQPLRFPNSLGWLYGQVTELLGFRPRGDEHKTQWLSSQGAPDRIDVFQRMFSMDPGGLPVLDQQYVSHESSGTWRLSPSISAQVGPVLAANDASARAATVASSLQRFVEDTVCELAERYRRITNARHLCLAGGVFLNGLLVRAVERRTGFERVFVQPVSDNPGTAIGAGHLARRRLQGRTDRTGLRDLQLGPAFDPREIKSVLDNCKLIYRYCSHEKELLEETTRLLLKDKIVAWYQGRLEFGRRALGNRSILASPFAPFVKENLNHYLKHREDFHPFVLSVPSGQASQYFDASENCRFAASVGELRPGMPALAPFTFGGGRVRLHLADAGVNPRFDALLRRFGASAPAPILVNTSFNLFGEPLVCDPRAAVRSFYCSGIDALVIGDFVIVK